jgi:WD40 repeat protein
MSLTPDEEILATVGTDGTIKLWSLDSRNIPSGKGDLQELENLMRKGCDWLKSYLMSNPEESLKETCYRLPR